MTVVPFLELLPVLATARAPPLLYLVLLAGLLARLLSAGLYPRPLLVLYARRDIFTCDPPLLPLYLYIYMYVIYIYILYQPVYMGTICKDHY